MRPDQTAVVIQKTLQGFPSRSIAQEIGQSHTSVIRAQNRPEVKAKIERAGEYIINRGLRPAVKTLCRLAAMGNVKDADKDSLKLSLDASKHITGIAGLSGGTPSTIINAMIQINQAPEQQQELSTIAAFLSSQWRQDTNQIIIESDNHTIIQSECKESKHGPIRHNDIMTLLENDISTGIPTPHTPSPNIINISPQPTVTAAPGSCHEQSKIEANNKS